MSKKNISPIDKVEFVHTLLPNGMKIITERVPASESFALGITINAGSRDELAGLEGCAHFLEHAAFKRSQKLNARQIAYKFESLGAYSNAFTTKEFTCFYVRALSRNLIQTLRTLLEITFNPLYQKNEIDREKQIIIEEIKSYDDDPEELIFDYGDDALFAGHPLANPILGTTESVIKITQDDLKYFHDKYYNPGNIIISAAGNIDHDLIVSSVEAFFKGRNYESLQKPLLTPPDVTPVHKTITKPVAQAHLLMGRRIGSVSSFDRYAVAVLNVLFGDGMSSRLYQRLRERKGLAYAIYSTIQLYKDSGSFYIYSGLDETNIRKARKIIGEEMKKLLDSPPGRAELLRAKEQLKSGIIMELESLSARMQNLAKSEIFFGYNPDVKEITESIEEVSSAQILGAAQQYLRDEDWSFIELLPEK